MAQHATRESAYEDVFTVVHDLGVGRDIAWIRGAIWPPVGTVVELESPERHALTAHARGDARPVRLVDVRLGR